MKSAKKKNVKNNNKKPKVEYGEYKGSKLIKLPMGENKDGTKQFFFQFGIGKAKLVVDYIDEIKFFVEENSE